MNATWSKKVLFASKNYTAMYAIVSARRRIGWLSAENSSSLTFLAKRYVTEVGG